MNAQLRKMLVQYAKSIDNPLWETRYGEEVSKEEALKLLGLVEEVCENCQYWGKRNSILINDTTHAVCENKKLELWHKSNLDHVADTLIMYGERYGTTGPRFGCVHWEGKEVKDAKDDTQVR